MKLVRTLALAAFLPCAALAGAPMETVQPVDGSGAPLGTDVNPLVTRAPTGQSGSTVTANQGTPAAGTSAWPFYLTQGGSANGSGNPIFANITNLPSVQAITAAQLPASLGAKTGANSLSVVLASDQGSVPVTVGNFPATQPVSGTVTANLGTLNGAATDASVQQVKTALGSPFQAGGSIGNAFVLDTTVTARLGTLGQKAAAGSAPVVLASDQPSIPTVPAASTAAIGPVPVTSTTSSLVGKASAGNLYGYSVTAGSTAGFLALLNAAAIPSAGAAIAPVELIPVPVNGYVARRQDIADRYGTGIVLVFTSSATTYTAVAPALMTAVVQ